MWGYSEKLQATGITQPPSVPNIIFGGLNSCFAKLFWCFQKSTPLSYQHTKKINSYSLPYFKYSIWHSMNFLTTFNALIFFFKIYSSLELTIGLQTRPWVQRDERTETQGYPRRAQSSCLCGEGVRLGTGKWDKYKTDSQKAKPFHYHQPMVCLLRYANGCGSCSGHKGAAFFFHWLPLLRGACSVSLRQGHLHCTRHCWELWGLPAWQCWTEQTVFFSDCTKLNLDCGAEIYIYFIIDFIKPSTRKQKLWATQHLKRCWE